jgi:hypothetical protein
MMNLNFWLLSLLFEGGEDRGQPVIERGVQLQHRDISPGVQGVGVLASREASAPVAAMWAKGALTAAARFWLFA